MRAGPALYGANPTPKVQNPMLPVIDLQARIVNVCNCLPAKRSAKEAGRHSARRGLRSSRSVMPTALPARRRRNIICGRQSAADFAGWSAARLWT